VCVELLRISAGAVISLPVCRQTPALSNFTS
jgi:hypothetical protein